MEQLPDQPYKHGLSKNSSRDIEKDSKSNEISKRAGSGSVDSVDGLESLGVNIVTGRPNVFKILEEEVTNSEGPVSVDSEWLALYFPSWTSGDLCFISPSPSIGP